MTLYRHVPSITNFPVYLGNLDTLIDPFLDGWSDEEARRKLRLFLNYLDRTTPTPSAMPTWARRPPGRAACCWRCSPRCRTPSPTSR